MKFPRYLLQRHIDVGQASLDDHQENHLNQKHYKKLIWRGLIKQLYENFYLGKSLIKFIQINYTF